MPRTEARGDQRGGKLEAGLDADFEGEIVGVFKLVIADDWHEGTEHFKGSVKVEARFDGVGEPNLSVPTKLEGTTAVVALNIQWSSVVIIYIKLLPDCANASSDERPQLYLSRPSENPA